MKPFHDVHIHNYLSTCSGDNQATVENYIAAAKAQGLSLMGFANHVWDESIPFPARSGFYAKQSMAYQMQIKSQIPKNAGIKILVGMETEYCGMYDVLGMGKEAALQLDFLLIPHTHVHMRDFVMPMFDDVREAKSKLRQKLLAIPGIQESYVDDMVKRVPEADLEPYMPEQRVDRVGFVADFMVNSFRTLMHNETLKSYSDLIPVSIAHPFQPVNQPNRADMMKRISDDTFGELFSITAARGIGLEINPYTSEDDFRMFHIAKECGCRFTLGSDTHSRDGFKNIQKTEALTDRLGLTEYDMMDFTRI